MHAAVREATATGDPFRVAAALIAHGAPFVLAAREADEDAVLAVVGTFLHWCSGWVATNRADEPELRLRVAREVYDAEPGLELFGRALASAIVALPAGHAERDLVRARELVDAGLADAREGDDPDEELELLAVALDGDLEPDAGRLIARGDTLAAEHPGSAADVFLDAARRHAMGCLSDAEEARDPEGVKRWAAVVAERSAAYGAGDLDAAVALQAAGRWLEAAERWGAVVAAGDLGNTAIQNFAYERSAYGSASASTSAASS